MTPMAAIEKRVKAEMKESINIPKKTIKTQISQRTVKSKPTLKKNHPLEKNRLKRKLIMYF